MDTATALSRLLTLEKFISQFAVTCFEVGVDDMSVLVNESEFCRLVNGGECTLRRGRTTNKGHIACMFGDVELVAVIEWQSDFEGCSKLRVNASGFAPVREPVEV